MKRYGTVTKRHSHTGTCFDPGRSRTDMTKPRPDWDGASAVGPMRFELTTFCSGDRRSIH